MALSEQQIKVYQKRLLLSRTRILLRDGFYGLLLMHMNFSLDESCQTAATDGYRIYFAPRFLDELSDRELDFVMMHEILHVALQHCQRDGGRDPEVFNIACDIVVNSNILLSNGMNTQSITIKKYGESMHLTPDRQEGYLYSAEEVYRMLDGSAKKKVRKNGGFALGRAEKKIGRYQNGSFWDDHHRWTVMENDTTLRDVWVKRITDAAECIRVQNPSDSRGKLPLFAKRLVDRLTKPQTDWRIILSDFVSEEVCDYSFSPPDRRFDSSPFFLPDFNGTQTLVRDILFMVDTSASMSDAMLTAAFSEIAGAIYQFDGKLRGWLGFFDAAIIEPVPFESVEELKLIQPAGGGGTDFQIIFEYVHHHMKEHPPASIIILTDGFAPFPKEQLAGGIPVLWLLNNQEVNPPWGKVARIHV